MSTGSSSGKGKTLEVQQVANDLYVPMTVGPFEMQTLILSKTDCLARKKHTERLHGKTMIVIVYACA